MVWIRASYFSIDFQCCYVGNFMLSKRAKYENVRVIERYTERPTDDIGSWADKISRDTAEEASRIACEELSIRFYGCDINVTNLRYTEMLVVPPKAVPPAPKPPEVPKPKVPKFVLDELEYLERFKDEAETYDEKKAFQDEIDKLKRLYGIQR